MAAAKALVPLALVMLFGVVSVAPADGPALSVNAGPAQALCFPATDLTLFGQASAGEGAPVAVRWAVAEGPAPVVFSAPWALATTATFSQTGSYLLRLSARSGASESASTVTVNVSPASSQRAFYVDPDFAGKGDGSESKPWTALGMAADTPQWKEINQALAQGPVIVYFSAREAGADTSEETTQPINVLRTDTSTNHLTVDGMSKYNTDDAHPSWADYAGPCQMRVRLIGGGGLAIGIDATQPQYPMNHVTVRGFETTGDGARVQFGGNDSVVEHLYIHDIMKEDPSLGLHPAIGDHHTVFLGRLANMTIRKVVIERGMGEGMYIASNYRLDSDGGWPEYGNTHTNILIEGNVIRDPGWNRGQGEGIDMKTGLQNVTIRGNLIERTHPADVAGISCEGVFGDVRSNYLLEGNRVSGAGTGIVVGGQNGAVIRNNVVSDNAGSGIALSGGEGVVSRDVAIYNNTVYGNDSAGISIGDWDGVTLKNNLVFGNNARWGVGPQIAIWGSSHVTSDYNLLSEPAPNWPEGPHSVITDEDADWRTDSGRLVVGLGRRDLHLAPGSLAIGMGADLSATGFASDIEGVARPQGKGWDIGAYEWRESAR